jgi:hypothetical protein
MERIISMKRKETKPKTIATRTKRKAAKFDAAAMYSELRDRIEALEEVVASLQSQEDEFSLPVDLVESSEVLRRGPKPKYQQDTFTH